MTHPPSIAIIGGGPSGLMAAEILGSKGYSVTVYERMPTVGRKLLMAGRGGLTLTHSEPLDNFIERYGEAAQWLAPYIQAFPPSALCAWCESLGEETFIGSSRRIFPRSMKAAPLLRAWLARLEKLGVRIATRHYWQGWEGESLTFLTPSHDIERVKADATLLALGGASWPRLGADGSWQPILAAQAIPISPLRPANCGFIVPWTNHFSTRFAGTPLKPVTLKHQGLSHQGELMITAQGIEGGAVYALSSQLREAITREGSTQLTLDLRPTQSMEALTKKLCAPRGHQSFSTYLRKAGFSPVAISLLREVIPSESLATADASVLASWLKALPITLTSTTGLARAISTAGGIRQSAITPDFMLKAKPGIFVAGEMLDWEAPTGGYLLQACFSTAVAAAHGIIRYLTK